MTVDNVLGVVFALGVMAYLVAALLFPERMG
jgi:K+-transporting ATPase KdpF subunit